MSIRPPTDIILDVARAADPQRLAAATNRLQTFALQKADPTGFTQVAEGVERGKARQPGAGPDMTLARLADTAAHRRAQEKASPHAPYRQFEAVVLRSFVESMMPSRSEVAFGKGTAGQIWKGMLADELGSSIARAGGIGIAKQVAAVHGPKTPGGDQRLFETLWQSRVAAPRVG
jgi:hypothetical protein